MARLALARTQRPEAFQVLAAGYDQPEEPTWQVRYSIAGIMTDWLQGATYVGAYGAMRKKHHTPADAWLWYRSLADEGCPSEVAAEVATSNLPTELRVAAIEVLASRRDEHLLSIIPGILEELPQRSSERYMMLGGLAACVDSWRGAGPSPVSRMAALCLARLMDQNALSADEETLATRYLASAFRCDGRGVSGAAWIHRILGGAAKDDGRAEDESPVCFYGIPCSGSRIVYMLDMSDSMNQVFNVAERQRVRLGGAEATAPDVPRRPASEHDGPEVPRTQEIMTHFDAAKIALARSLRQLTPSYSFAVVGFGSQAALLTKGPGLERATPENVSAALRSVGGAECGMKGPCGPSTNLHGALRLAFRLTLEGVTEDPVYVNATTILQGANVLYVLTDGDPTDDDWSTLGGWRPNGTYALPSMLLQDVRRMNFFRKAEIHCVGIGTPGEGLLVGLARIGLGRVHLVGEEAECILDARGANIPGAPQDLAGRPTLIEDKQRVYRRDGRPKWIMRRRVWTYPAPKKPNDPCADRPLHDLSLQELGRLLESGAARERMRAVTEIGCRGSKAVSAVPWLFALLRRKTTTGFEVGAVMRAFPRLGEEIAPLLRAALFDESTFMRVAAAGALGRMSGSSEATVKALVSALSDSCVSVRTTVASALGRIGAPAVEAAPALALALQDEYPDVRRVAAWALGCLGQGRTETLLALRRALHDKEAAVRVAAREALDKLTAGER